VLFAFIEGARARRGGPSSPVVHRLLQHRGGIAYAANVGGDIRTRGRRATSERAGRFGEGDSAAASS